MTSRRWNRSCRLLGILVAVFLVLSAASFAAENPGAKKAPAKPSAQPAMSPEEMMAAYAKFATPGPEHEFLKSMAGNWKTVTKAWMGPGEPQAGEGRSVRSMILGGRYLKDEITSTFMNQPFEGFGITGYDLQKKEYVSSWTDTMGTGVLMSHGKVDPTGKILTMTAAWDDPVTHEHKTMKEVTRLLDNNRQVFEIWENQAGKEVKTMEITYTRE
jgi:hypothetical protein